MPSVHSRLDVRESAQDPATPALRSGRAVGPSGSKSGRTVTGWYARSLRGGHEGVPFLAWRRLRPGDRSWYGACRGVAELRRRRVEIGTGTPRAAASAATPPRLTVTRRGNRDSDQGCDDPARQADADHPHDRGRAGPRGVWRAGPRPGCHVVRPASASTHGGTTATARSSQGVVPGGRPAPRGRRRRRFNTRGTESERGKSEGEFSGGVTEKNDVEAAVDYAASAGLPHIDLLGGRSAPSGAEYGALPPVEGAILLSPPLHRATDEDLDTWAASGKPLIVMVPELDDYLRPEEARQRFARVPKATVIGVDGAKHLRAGENYVRIVLDEIARPRSTRRHSMTARCQPTGRVRRDAGVVDRTPRPGPLSTSHQFRSF